MQIGANSSQNVFVEWRWHESAQGSRSWRRSVGGRRAVLQWLSPAAARKEPDAGTAGLGCSALIHRCRCWPARAGPQVYGDQSGNNRAGLPGNVYRDQFLTAQRLLRTLDDGRKKQALIAEAPVQTQIELQGRSGSFPGIPVADLAPEGKGLARE